MKPNDGVEVAGRAPRDGRGVGMEPADQAGPVPSSESGTMTSPDRRNTRWADHRAARRAELVMAAYHAVERLGPGVSMEDIAHEADTSKSIFYRYFEDKASLRQAVADIVIGHLHDAVLQAAKGARSPRAGLRAMISVYLETIEQSPNVYRYINGVSFDQSHPAGTGAGAAADTGAQAEAGANSGAGAQGNLGGYLDAVIAEVAQLTGSDLAEEWAAGSVGFVRGVGERWLAQREAGLETLTRQQLTDRIARWLWDGPDPPGVGSHNPPDYHNRPQQPHPTKQKRENTHGRH